MRVELISSLQHKQTRRNFTEPNLEREERGDEKQQQQKKRAAVSLCPKGSTGWMSHWPQSVNEPADPCNKLLGRTAELEICRHSQNQPPKK